MWALGLCTNAPAGKLSAAAEPGTGRDGDDKAHCLKPFSSDAQLTVSDMKAQAASLWLHVRHTPPSLTPQHAKRSHPLLPVVKRVGGPVSVFNNPCVSQF